MDALPKKASTAITSSASELDDLYGEEGDEEESPSTTDVSDDAMIKMKSKLSADKKGPRKLNKNDTHTKKKTKASSKKKQ